MKIVLDTNVLISSIVATTGISQEVVSRVEENHVLILSDYILDEFKKNLIQKFDLSLSEVASIVSSLIENAVVLQVKVNPKIHFSDSKDVPILSLLEVAKAHYFITGDKELLSLKKFGLTSIITPREAMEIL